MTQHLLTYFAAEKSWAAFLILVAAAAFGFSSYLWRNDRPYKAMVYPLIGIGLLQLAVGASVYLRTDGQAAALLERLASSPMDFRTEELQRMRDVLDRLTFARLSELVVLLTGIVLALKFRQSTNLYAVGIGLIVQSCIMLVVDFLATHRAEMYVVRLQEFVPDLI